MWQIVAVLVLVFAVIQYQQKKRTPDDVPYNPAVPVSDVIVVENCGYAPVGTLSDDNGRVLQLYGKPCRSHRDRYNYFTMVDDSRIPVELEFNGRRCENDTIGCDPVYSGDRMTAREFGTARPLRVNLYNQ